MADTFADAFVGIRADTSRFQADMLAGVRSTLKAVQVKVTADTRPLERDVRTAAARVSRSGVKVKVAPDFTKFSPEVRAFLAGFSEEEKIKIGAALERASFARVVAQAKQIARQGDANIKVRADTSGATGGLNALSRALRGGAQEGRSFGQMVKLLKFPILVSGAALAAQALNALGAAAIGLVSSLGQAAGVIGALPGLLAAAGQGAITLAFGLSGIGKALKAHQSLQAASTGEATKAARAAVTSAATQRNSAEAVASAERGVTRARQSARDAAIDAASRITDANRGVARAQQAAADAAADSIRRVADAQRGLADAQRAAGEAAAASMRRIQDAQRGLADANRSLADAQRDAAVQMVAANRRIEDSIRALADAQRDVAESIIDANRRIEDSAEAVADAERDAGRAVEDAARRVAAAERSLADAQRDATRAQEDLNDAREEAVERLEDLRLEQERHALSEERAILNLDEARDRLAELNAENAKSEPFHVEEVLEAHRLGIELTTKTTKQVSELEKRAAELSVREAEQSLKEIREAREDSSKELADANRKGVEGADNVVAAQERVAEANERITDAARNLAEAQSESAQTQVDAAERIADAQRALADAQADAVRVQEDGSRRLQEAQRGVTDAQEDAARQQVDANERIADAQRGVQDAARNVAEAQADAARSAADSARNISDAQRAVSDAHIDAARSARDSGQAIQDAQRAVAEAQADAARSARDSGQAIADAQRAVTEALADQATASDKAALAAETGAAAANVFQAAMDGLSPAARRFVEFLIAEVLPAIAKLKAAAAAGLLPGLERAIRILLPLTPMLADVLFKTGQAIGLVAEKGAKMLASGPWTHDFKLLASQNVILIGRFGDVALNLADALRNIMVAAMPLVDWISRLAVKWSEQIKGAAEAGRQSGALTRFFEGTRRTLEKVIDILTDFGVGLKNVLVAAKPLGDFVLGLIGDMAERFRTFTESAEGKKGLKKFFEDAKKPIKEVFALVEAVAKAFLGFGSGGKLPELLKQIRVELLPALKDAAEKLSGAFGPAVVGALTSIVTLIGNLGNQGGSITVFAAALGNIADVLNFLITKVPGFKDFLGILITFGATVRALKFASSITGVTGFVSALKKLNEAKTAGKFGEIAGKFRDVGSKAASAATSVGKAAASMAKSVATATAKTVAAIATQIARWVVLGVQSLIHAAKVAAAWLISLGPIALIVAAVIALVVVIVKNWDKIKDVILKAGKVVGDFLTKLWNGIKDKAKQVWDAIVGFLKGVWETIKKAVKLYFDAYKAAIGAVWDAIKKAAKVVWDAIKASLVAVWAAIKLVVTTYFNAYKTVIQAVWNAIKAAAKIAWDAIKKVIADVFEGIKTVVKGALDKVKGTFTSAVDGIRTIWDRLKAAAKAPVKFVIETVLNKGIIGAWNWISDNVLGGKLHVNPIKLPSGFHTGGIMPGYTPGRDTQLAAVSGGEAIMRPEWTRAVGADRINAWNAAARSGGVAAVQSELGIPGFALGGIIGKLKDLGSKVWDTAKRTVAGVTDFLANPAAFLLKRFGSSLEGLTQISGSGFGKMIAEVPRQLIGRIVEAAKDLVFGADPQATDFGGGDFAAGGGGGGSAVGTKGGAAAIKAFIKSTDPLPYVWGGVGPGGYDCSGITGEVWNRITGHSSFHRAFTTASNFAALGFKPGAGGTYSIGVVPGHHMAGEYGGLKFEAASTKSGIKIGGPARSVGSFPVRYHLAKGGIIGQVQALAKAGADIGGDPGGIRIAMGRRLPRIVRPDEEFFGLPIKAFHGGGKVDRDQLAFLQGGERVLSRAQERDRMAGDSLVINVDARGAGDPAAVEAAARRGAQAALQQNYQARLIRGRR